MKTVEIVASRMIERSPAQKGYRAEQRMKSNRLRKSPITHRSQAQTSESVGDVRIVNNRSVRPFLPQIQPALQPSFGYRKRRMGENSVHSRRFGHSNFWGGTPLENSPVLGDPRVFEADELFKGIGEVGFVWNVAAGSLDAYVTRNGETWIVRLPKRRLIYLFNKGLELAGSSKRIPYGDRPTVGGFFDSLGTLIDSIGNKMIEPAARDIGRAIETVANNPIVQGIVTGMALIPPLTAIGGPALAALSVAKGVKAAGDVVGGVVTGIKHGFTSPEQALGLVNNIVGAVPGLPSAAQGIMQGALGAVGMGVKLASGGPKPAAIAVQAGSRTAAIVPRPSAPKKKPPKRWTPPKGTAMKTGRSVDNEVDAALALTVRDAKAAGLVVPPELITGLRKLMLVAGPTTRLPTVRPGETTAGVKTLQLYTPGGLTAVPFSQMVPYLERLYTEEKRRSALPKEGNTGLTAGELKAMGINPQMLTWAQANPNELAPLPASPGSVSEALNRAAPLIRVKFAWVLSRLGAARESAKQILGSTPLQHSVFYTIYNTPSLKALRTQIENSGALRSALISTR